MLLLDNLSFNICYNFINTQIIYEIDNQMKKTLLDQLILSNLVDLIKCFHIYYIYTLNDAGKNVLPKSFK